MQSVKNVIVTGGAGYIGSHTIIELYNAGFNPIIVDNLCNSSIKNINGINFILGQKIKWYNIDCTIFSEMKKIFNEESNIFGCIHFAAYKSVEESIRLPEKYYSNNVNSLKVLLKCMKHFSVNNLIFSSSCTVYGSPDRLPVYEYEKFKRPESVYSETKQICEEILSLHDISNISLRYFNPIGTHESILIGDCSVDKPSNLVPIISEVAVGERDFITVNGSDYDTNDGTCIRDYIHVSDLAMAHVNAFNYLLENNNLITAFNVGTGKGLSVLEIIEAYEKTNCVKINYKIGPRRVGDIEKIFANVDLIKKELKWTPKKSLDEALSSEYKWKKNI